MCNRYRMSAKQADLAKAFGLPEHLIMPEPEPLPPPELFPERIGWVVRKEGGAPSRHHEVGLPGARAGARSLHQRAGGVEE